MAKKKKNEVAKILTLVSLGLVALAIILFVALDVVIIGDDACYSGMQVLFGYKDEGKYLVLRYFDANIVYIIAFIAAIAAGVLPLFMPSKLFKFICGAVLICVGVVVFLIPTIVPMGFTEDGVLDLLLRANSSLEIALSTGSIISAILFICGGLVDVYLGIK